MVGMMFISLRFFCGIFFCLGLVRFLCVFFYVCFFLAEDGIRVGFGVQSFALPVYFKGVLLREVGKQKAAF